MLCSATYAGQGSLPGSRISARARGGRSHRTACCAQNATSPPTRKPPPILLPLLGNYLDARTLLLWLAIPSFVAAFYATSDRLLIIAGQANVALVVTASSFAILMASPFVTARWLGPVAIPAAMILAIAVVNPLVAVRARQLVGVSTFHWLDAILMACGSVALAAAAVAGTYLSAAVACAMLAAIGAYYVTTALSRSSGDDYDNSLIFAARESAVNAPLALSDKASQ